MRSLAGLGLAARGPFSAGKGNKPLPTSHFVMSMEGWDALFYINIGNRWGRYFSLINNRWLVSFVIIHSHGCLCFP